MSTSSGACVARARLAAALGSPMPTKQVMPSRSARAADTVIISSDVYVKSLAPRRGPEGRSPSRGGLGGWVPPRSGGVAPPGRKEPFQPPGERLAFPRDGIPGHVVVVVTGRV